MLTVLLRPLTYAIIWSCIFLESGLLIFLFLPGDSLIFTAGFLASQDLLNIWVLCIGCFIASVTGNMLGYAIGEKAGKRYFIQNKSRFIKRRHIARTKHFYRLYGSITIVIARFVPIVRTLAPFMAGIVKMPYRHFMIYNAIGALLWGVGLSLLGYALGNIIPVEYINKYLLPIIHHYYEFAGDVAQDILPPEALGSE